MIVGYRKRKTICSEAFIALPEFSNKCKTFFDILIHLPNVKYMEALLTHRYGLLGYPLAHSFSPAYFAQKWATEGYDNCAYDLFPYPTVEEFWANEVVTQHPATNAAPLEGFNVTVPHKRAIIPFLDRLDATARETGAVNTVRRETHEGQTKWVGYNTDAHGFAASLAGWFAGLGVSLEGFGRSALVLGSGGASAAVQYALRRYGIPYNIVSRNALPEEPHTLTYTALTHFTDTDWHTFGLIINTTPLGMFPHTDTLPPLPYPAIVGTPAPHYFFDLVYNPTQTAFLTAALTHGCPTEHTKNGLEMLHLQADKAWEIWRGV